jgi:hypothetical protein
VQQQQLLTKPALAHTAQACCLLGALQQQASAAALVLLLQTSYWTAMTMVLLLPLLVRAVAVLPLMQACSSCWQQQGMACSRANSSRSSSSAYPVRCGPWLPLMQQQRMAALLLLLLPQPTGTRQSLTSYVR